MKQSWRLLSGIILISFIFLLMLVSVFWLPYDPNVGSGAKFEEPSLSHLFGTDDLGRDLFSRILMGSRTVFLVGLISVGIGFLGGVLLGSLAGFLGGKVDAFIMVIMDSFMSFPGILFALMYVGVFGYGLLNTMIALGIMAIPSFARITRSGFLQNRSSVYVQLARSIGVRPFRLMFVHILPNVIGQIIVAASMGFASAILSEAGLSYLGLGVQPPDPSWGRMLTESQNSFFQAPHYALIPGIMITLAVLGFNFLGDGLRDLAERREG